jgi:hypothetical protein
VQKAADRVGDVGGQLGAVQRHGADPHHPGGGAQLEGGDQEAGQSLLVADAEPRNRHVVRGLVGGQHAEGDVFVAAPFDLPGGAHADAVGVEQHAEQGLGVVGGVVLPVVTMRPVEGGQVELVDDVEDEPGEVAFGSQSRRSGGRRKGWSRSPRRKL